MLQFGLIEKRIKLSLVYFILNYTTVDIRVHKRYIKVTWLSSLKNSNNTFFNAPTNIFLFSSIQKHAHCVLFICFVTVITQSMLIVMTSKYKASVIFNYYNEYGYIKDTLAIL